MSEKRIAKIKATFLGWEDHGLFTFCLTLDYGDGGHQGFGHYAVSEHEKALDRQTGTAAGMDALMRIVSACGVNCWEELQGRTVYALLEDGWVRGIEPLPTERGEPFHVRDVWPKEKPE